MTFNKAFYILRPILNLSLRCFTLLIKFFFIAYAVKVLDQNEYGYYTFQISAISYGIYIIGFDFYTYSNRKYLSAKNNEEKSKYLSNHFLFSLLSMTFWLLPIILFFQHKMTGELFTLCLILLYFEYISQEIYRYLVIQERQITATVIIFIKQSSWAIIFILLSKFDIIEAKLVYLLIFWMVSLIISCCIGLYYILHKEKVKIEINFFSINLITKGMLLSLPMLISALSSRGILFFDKYYILNNFGSDSLAIYGFFFSIAFTLITLCESFIVSFFLPKIIKEGQRKNYLSLKKLSFLLFLSLFVFSFISVLIFYFSFDIILLLLNKEVWISEKNTFLIIMLTGFLACLAYSPYYFLYALNRDKSILITQLICFFIFVLILFVTKPTTIYNVSILLLINYIITFSLYLTYSIYIYKLEKSKCQLGY